MPVEDGHHVKYSTAGGLIRQSIAVAFLPPITRFCPFMDWKFQTVGIGMHSTPIVTEAAKKPGRINFIRSYHKSAVITCEKKEAISTGFSEGR